MKTIALTRCPTCAGEAWEDAGIGGLRRCTSCGTVYAAEYADPDAVFQEGYLSGGTGSFGIDLSHPRWHRFLLETGASRCAIVEAAAGVRRGRLVDVGCGSGEFLEAAVARGWDAVGVEPLADASAMARSRGVDVRTSTLEESGLPEDSFDVVSAFHVLEHMPDAPAFLRTLARWAKPGGVVVIESPNWDAVARERDGAGWMHLRPLEHLVHLTPATLGDAFRRAGLEPLALRSPSHLSPSHTLDEALSLIGRPHWRRALAPASPQRTVEGARGRVPSAPVRALLRAVAGRDDRSGRGPVVLGVARRPAT